MRHIESMIERLITMFLNIGIAWFIAWCVKPDLPSNTVWFFAVLYAFLASDLDELKQRWVKK